MIWPLRRIETPECCEVYESIQLDIKITTWFHAATTFVPFLVFTPGLWKHNAKSPPNLVWSARSKHIGLKQGILIPVFSSMVKLRVRLSNEKDWVGYCHCYLQPCYTCLKRSEATIILPSVAIRVYSARAREIRRPPVRILARKEEISLVK